MAVVQSRGSIAVAGRQPPKVFFIVDVGLGGARPKRQRGRQKPHYH